MSKAQKLEDQYRKSMTILDKDFCKKFPKETEERILELNVANQIVQLTKEFDINISNGCLKKDQGGPDFVIKCPNYNIFIECVCANDSQENNVVANCVITEIPLFIENKTCATARIKIGLDKIVESRISSVIYDKAKKIQAYKDKGIIKNNDIVILVVSTNLKNINDVSFEFESVIGDLAIVEDENSIKFEKNIDGIFKKNGKDIKLGTEELEQFNIFVLASKFAVFKEKNNSEDFFNYKVYLRTQQYDSSKGIIEKIFHSNIIEYNRYMYRSDNNF